MRLQSRDPRMRFDLSSLAVMGMAVVSALATAWWMDQGGLRSRAEAATVYDASAYDALAARSADAQVLRAADGHYWADAMIDGRAVRVMVDTGASVVVLTRADAARLGLDLEPADFASTVVTASGPVRAAPVSLDAVAVAGARVEQVEALVVEEGLPHSLLGMSYLGRLSAFTATPVALTLRP